MVTSVLSVDRLLFYPQHPTSETNVIIAWQRYTTLGGQINHNFKCTGRETALFHCDQFNKTVTSYDVGIKCSPGKPGRSKFLFVFRVKS